VEHHRWQYDRLCQSRANLVDDQGGGDQFALIMGAGYDAAEDLNSSNNIGNSIYIINGDTGALIKELATDYSVPSDVTVVDANGDGEPDRAYVADVRGNVYRVDFPSSGSLLDFNSWAATTAVKIADVGGKVFYAPDVVVTKDFIAVLVGTGDREKPLLASTTDKFVLIKDNVGLPRAGALTLAGGDFTRVANRQHHDGTDVGGEPCQ
jgi:type IV pilus assembly protein PilY1